MDMEDWALDYTHMPGLYFNVFNHFRIIVRIRLADQATARKGTSYTHKNYRHST